MHRSNEDWSRVVNGIGERHLLVVVMSDTLYLETDAGLRSIQLILTNKLNESGWTDDLRHQSKERARNMEPLSFRMLLAELSPHVQTSMPLAVRKEVMAVIRQYVEKQFE